MICVFGWGLYSPREMREARQAAADLAVARRDLRDAVGRSRARHPSIGAEGEPRERVDAALGSVRGRLPKMKAAGEQLAQGLNDAAQRQEQG